MDKPSGTPENGRAERATIEAVASRIKALLAMAKTVRSEPDLSDVWESEDFLKLSDGAKAELRALAGVSEDGEKPATEAAAPKEASIDIGNDSRTSWIAEQVKAIVRMSATVHEKPDLSVIWTGEDFLKLEDDVQAAAKAWVAEKYGISDDEEEEAAAPSAPEGAPAVPENNEKKPVPKRRDFVGYRVTRDGGKVVVHEDFREWDDEAQDYRDRTQETTMALPAERAGNATDEDVIRFMDTVRADLDRRAVKMFFDRPQDEPEKVFPKWKYFLGGKKSEEPVPVDEIPADVLALVKADKDGYHRTPEWKKWFGRQMQKKREDIIAAETARRFALPGETAAAQKTENAEPATDEAPRPFPPEVVRAGVQRQVEMFARIFRPESAEEHIRYIIDSVRGTLEHPVIGPKRPPVDRDFLWTAVREELFARFSGEDDKAALEAVKAAMPKEDAVRRYVGRAVSEALGTPAPDENGEARASVTEYLTSNVLGTHENAETVAKVQSSLASYDEATGRVVIPDAERTRAAIMNLHRHLTKGGEGAPEKKDA
jgi:hypothetical protein